MKLMLAEDEPGLSRALTAILQHSDYEVDTALDGLTALEYLLANDYDAAVVPDPYYGLNEGFNQVLDYCTDACGGLLETLERKARMMQKSLQATKAAG